MSNRFNPAYGDSYLAVDDDHKLVLSDTTPISVEITEPLEVEFATPQAVTVSGTPNVAVTNTSIDATREYATASLTIAQNASVSDSFDMRAYAGGYFITPNGLQGIIHFLVSSDNSTFYPLDDEFNTPITITTTNPATEAKAMVIPAKLFAGFYVKIATYTTALRTSAQTQSSARTIGVLLKS